MSTGPEGVMVIALSDDVWQSSRQLTWWRKWSKKWGAGPDEW